MFLKQIVTFLKINLNETSFRVRFEVRTQLEVKASSLDIKKK
jgi:hypothetical protein